MTIAEREVVSIVTWPRSSRRRQARWLRFEGEPLWALDQTLLPFSEIELALRSAEEVAQAIRRLAIRVAPLIGVAAGYGVALVTALGVARPPTRESIAALPSA